jgi:hypothetical protein
MSRRGGKRFKPADKKSTTARSGDQKMQRRSDSAIPLKSCSGTQAMQRP